MSNIILIDEFDFTDFLADKELINQEIKGKGVNYPIEIESILGSSSIELKIIISSCQEENNQNELIPIKELIFQEESPSEAEEKIILDGDDLVLIFTIAAGVYYIPINIKDVRLDRRNNKQTVVSGRAVITGEVLNVGRKKIDRVSLDLEVDYFISALKYQGLIKDITSIGARLVAGQEIRCSKLIVDFRVTEIPFEKMPCKINWKRKIGDREFIYGLNFKFRTPAEQEKLEKWLMKNG